MYQLRGLRRRAHAHERTRREVALSVVLVDYPPSSSTTSSTSLGYSGALVAQSSQPVFYPFGHLAQRPFVLARVVEQGVARSFVGLAGGNLSDKDGVFAGVGGVEDLAVEVS
jgi:hypothetical protein